MTLSLRIDLAPRGKERPRSSEGRRGVYTPQTTIDWEHNAAAQIRAQLVAQGHHAPLTGPLAVEMVAVFRRREDMPKVRRTGREWAPVRPDLDNIEKSVWDAVVLAKAIKDDGQIVQSHNRKVYAAVGEPPHILLTLAPAPALEVA